MAPATSTKTGLLNTAGCQRKDWPIKGGKIRVTPSFMKTGAWRRAISHSLRCRGMCSQRSNWPHDARVAWDSVRGDRASTLEADAERLAEKFESAFWCPEIKSYALALDGEKNPCRVRASNAGQALLSGIARNERAADVARALLGSNSFSGWGIRTVAKGEARYNPMSYHDGSVWSHEN